MIAWPAELGLTGARRLLWPLALARHIWTGAVAGEEAIQFNLGLLTALTALLSLPELAQGVMGATGSSSDAHLYWIYVVVLAVMELAGALLLARRSYVGRLLIITAAAGFYPEAALGLSLYERGVLPAAIVAVCIPAEAWVIWFLTHPRTHAYVRLHWKCQYQG